MTSVIDVAQFIVSWGERNFSVSMQLSRLCFFSQALNWHVFGRPLFSETSYAGTTAPLYKELVPLFKGHYFITKEEIGSYHAQLAPEEERVIHNAYAKFKGVYGDAFCQICRDYKIAMDLPAPYNHSFGIWLTAPPWLYPEIPQDRIKAVGEAFFA